MGLTFSYADNSAPPPMPDFSKPLSPAAQAAIEAARPKDSTPDFLNLPSPVRYEDMQREVMMALKPDHFEGLRFDVSRPLTQSIFLSNSILMGNMEVPAQKNQVIKIPIGNYELGITAGGEKHLLMSRISTEGRVTGRAIWNVSDWLSLKLQGQGSADDLASFQGMVDADLKGKDWNGQLKLGNPHFYGLNYFQSVLPGLAVGGEIFWLRSAGRSGVGLAARHQGEQSVATAQVATTGVVSLQYAHKVGDKVTLASDLLWNWRSREVTATVGYDCNLRQCRLRGRIDTNGVVSQFLEERFVPGISFVLSGEIDHWHKNYRFGFGITAGE